MFFVEDNDICNHFNWNHLKSAINFDFFQVDSFLTLFKILSSLTDKIMINSPEFYFVMYFKSVALVYFCWKLINFFT
jgi:hypothetical protein